MQRITSSDQLFHDADPFNGVQGTVVTAKWLNAVQEEIVSVIAGAGIALDGAQSNQLLAAIKAAAASVDNSSVNVVTTGGTTILNATQYGASFILVTGVLTANASLIFPAAIRTWTVINATSGAYALNCYASGGGGVPVTQGTLDGISCDGTNIRYLMGDAATQAAVQSNAICYASVSGTASAITAAYTPAVKTLTDGMILAFQAAASNPGACTFSPNGLPASPIIGGAHQALQGGEIVGGGKVEVMWHAGLTSWVLIGCTGGATQVSTATQPMHAVNLSQAQTIAAAAATAASVSMTQLYFMGQL